MDIDRRRRERHILQRKYVAHDEVTGELLGALVNIHSEGLMLIGGDNLQEDAVFQIALKSEGDVGSIRMGIDCVWSKEAQQEGRRWAGFRIIDASDQTFERIQDLIDKMSQGDHPVR